MSSILSNTETGDVTSGLHLSCWTETFIQSDRFRRPEHDETTDAVIIGCGISGASIAYNLLKSGKKVIIVEDGFPGSGETGRTSAHLTLALDIRYHELIKQSGKKHAALVAQSHRDAISFIEQTSIQEKIDCEFRRVNGYLFLHEGEKKEILEKEIEAIKELGIDAEYISQLSSVNNYTGPAIQFNNQAIFHPLKYLGGLCRAIERMGGIIYTGTRAEEIENDHIITDKGIRINAKDVIVATNAPVNNRVAMNATQTPFRSYIVASLISRNCLPSMLWWDTGDPESDTRFAPYHYARIEEYNEQYDLLICGGEDHAVGLPEDPENETGHYSNLEQWMRKHFPSGEIAYRWSGQVLYPPDDLANIGRNPFDNDHVYVVSGDCGNGLTYGTIAGMLITDLITGKQNPWEEVYRPSRTNIKSMFGFIKEFAGGLAEYIKRYPRKADEVDLSEINPGSAAVAELEGKKYGIYKDVNNKLHMVSAECTHLGCIVKWNTDELSWDCPCHGSRFTYNGTVINGPANNNLEYYTDPDQVT